MSTAGCSLFIIPSNRIPKLCGLMMGDAMRKEELDCGQRSKGRINVRNLSKIVCSGQHPLLAALVVAGPESMSACDTLEHMTWKWWTIHGRQKRDSFVDFPSLLRFVKMSGWARPGKDKHDQCYKRKRKRKCAETSKRPKSYRKIISTEQPCILQVRTSACDSHSLGPVP